MAAGSISPSAHTELTSPPPLTSSHLVQYIWEYRNTGLWGLEDLPLYISGQTLSGGWGTLNLTIGKHPSQISSSGRVDPVPKIPPHPPGRHDTTRTRCTGGFEQKYGRGGGGGMERECSRHPWRFICCWFRTLCIRLCLCMANKSWQTGFIVCILLAANQPASRGISFYPPSTALLTPLEATSSYSMPTQNQFTRSLLMVWWPDYYYYYYYYDGDDVPDQFAKITRICVVFVTQFSGYLTRRADKIAEESIMLSSTYLDWI